MRTHNHAVLLRLTEKDFLYLRQSANARSLSVQEFLRDLLRYGTLPKSRISAGKK